MFYPGCFRNHPSKTVAFQVFQVSLFAFYVFATEPTGEIRNNFDKGGDVSVGRRGTEADRCGPKM